LANCDVIRSLDLDVRLVIYDPAMTPFEKFWRGSEQVTTEFCSLCADDDLVFLESLPPLVDFLRHHPDFSAAHGWYFTFYENVHVGITSVVYAGPSIDHSDPLFRLRDMCGRYEAVTYSLYRSEVMRRALREVQRVTSMLARELLAGALTAVAGKIARLPLFYYGRSLSPSEPYVHWHPVDFLISSPEQLLLDYARYREILSEALGKAGGPDRDRDEVLRLIDLFHLKYLCEYVNPRIVEYLIDRLIAGKDRTTIMTGYWPLLTPGGATPPRESLPFRLIRKARDRFAPDLRRRHVRRFLGLVGDRTIRTMTASGRPREYWLYGGFRSSVARASEIQPASAIDGILRALNAYE
jgi:glycosyltransferase domain-containing protein